MNLDITNQAYLFLIFIVNGILIGIVFDVFRILRKSFKTPNYVTYIEDVLFWLISASIVMASVFIFNNGAFRGYIFIGILLGIAIYMLFFSKFVINISVKIISIISKIVTFVIRILSYPLNLIYKLFISPIIQIVKKFYNFLAKKRDNLKNKAKNKEMLQNKEGF